MGLSLEITEDTSRPRLRIAIPAWGRGTAPTEQVHRMPEPVRVEEIQSLLKAALNPREITPLRLTRNERRQMQMSRRLRRALYEVAESA